MNMEMALSSSYFQSNDSFVKWNEGESFANKKKMEIIIHKSGLQTVFSLCHFRVKHGALDKWNWRQKNGIECVGLEYNIMHVPSHFTHIQFKQRNIIIYSGKT